MKTLSKKVLVLALALAVAFSINITAFAAENTSPAAGVNFDTVTVDPVEDYEYNGSAIEPTLVLRDANGDVIDRALYDVTYTDNVNAGMAKYVITPKNAEAGTGSLNGVFYIDKASSEVVANDFSIVYGPNKTLTLKYSVDGDNKNITFTSSNPNVIKMNPDGTYKVIGAGTTTITINAKGGTNYSNSKRTITVTVKKKANPVTTAVSSKTYTASAKTKKTTKNYAFTIGTKTPQGKVTYTARSKYITVSTTGKVTVKKGIPRGTYKVYVKAAGNSNYLAKTKTIKIVIK